MPAATVVCAQNGLMPCGHLSARCACAVIVYGLVPHAGHLTCMCTASCRMSCLGNVSQPRCAGYHVRVAMNPIQRIGCDPSISDPNLRSDLRSPGGSDPIRSDRRAAGGGRRRGIQVIWSTSPASEYSAKTGPQESIESKPNNPPRWVAPKDGMLPRFQILSAPREALPRAAVAAP